MGGLQNTGIILLKYSITIYIYYFDKCTFLESIFQIGFLETICSKHIDKHSSHNFVFTSYQITELQK